MKNLYDYAAAQSYCMHTSQWGRSRYNCYDTFWESLSSAPSRLDFCDAHTFEVITQEQKE